MSDDEQAIPVEVDARELSPEALHAVVEEFVTREGTDYGHEDHALLDKVQAVKRQIARGEARIVFDPATETVSIVSTR